MTWLAEIYAPNSTKILYVLPTNLAAIGFYRTCNWGEVGWKTNDEFAIFYPDKNEEETLKLPYKCFKYTVAN